MTAIRRAIVLVAALLMVLPAVGRGAGDGEPSAVASSAQQPAVAALLPSPGIRLPFELPLAIEPGAASRDTAAALSSSRPAAKLPVCEYRDELTRYHKVKHWKKTLLDTNLRLKKRYAPWDLVSVSRAGIAGSGKVRKIVIKDLRAMAAAARRAGKPLAIRSAYRSYATQVATFQSWVRRSGYEQALKFSARPGHSEHQLGTTLDFTAAPGAPLSSSFGESPSGKWIARNGWKYGFIMPYPKGKKRVSCYGYEPWHWRYVGRELARQVHESGQVPRRFYWQNFESAP